MLHSFGFVLFRPCVVVRDLHPDLSGVFAFAAEIVPSITLPSSGNHDFLQTNPCFPNQVCPFIVVEY